jgi:WG containing repeat
MRKLTLLLLLFSSCLLAAQDYQSQSDGSSGDQKARTDLTPVQQNGKWGYADKDGHVVIRPQFSLAHGFSGGLALVWTGGVPLTDPVVTSFVRMGYIDQKGHWVIQSRFKNYFYYDFSEGLVSFRQQSKGWGYMNAKGKVVVRPRFQWAGSFANGIAPVLLDDRCAHIDKGGEITDQAQSALPRRKGEQGRNGTFLYKPRIPPCS